MVSQRPEHSPPQLKRQPSTVGTKDAQSGAGGLVTKERCDLCGTALCGTDKKLLGDCKYCGDVSAEKFEECRQLAEKAGFLQMRKEGLAKSEAQGQEDSVAVAKEKVEKFIVLGENLKPLIRSISTCGSRDDNFEKFIEIFDGLKDEKRKLESGGKPVSNERLSGWKTGLFGLRAISCQKIIDEFKEEKKSLSKRKKPNFTSLDAGLERLDKLCKEGNALAQQDVKVGLDPTVKNFKDMLSMVSVIKGYFKSFKGSK